MLSCAQVFEPDQPSQEDNEGAYFYFLSNYCSFIERLHLAECELYVSGMAPFDLPD